MQAILKHLTWRGDAIVRALGAAGRAALQAHPLGRLALAQTGRVS